MRPSPFSTIAQSLALVFVGLLMLAFVLMRTFTTIYCGGFLICKGSLLPPVNDTGALFEWIQHLSILMLVVFAIATVVLIVMVYKRQDWDMISALRITSFFFVAHGLAAAVTLFIGYGFQVFHLLAGALTLGAITVLMARVLFTDNDEYRQGTYLAALGLVSILSVIPYFWLFAG